MLNLKNENMNFRIIFTKLIFVLCFGYYGGFSQNFINVYTNYFPGGGNIMTGGMVTDNFDNLIYGIHFSGSVKVGETVYSSMGDRNSLLIKKDDNENIIWVRSLASEGRSYISGIFADDFSNLYVVGVFGGDSTFTGNLYVDPFILENDEGTRLFVLKYSPAGNVLWAHSVPISGDFNMNTESTNISGNGTDLIVITSDIYPLPTQNIGGVEISHEEGSAFYAVLDNDGNWVDAGMLPGENNEFLDINPSMNHNNEIFISGRFKGTMDLSPAQTINTPEEEYRDFIFKVDDNGDFQWAHLIDNYSWWGCRNIAHENNVYVFGTFKNDLDFGTHTISSGFNNSSFIAKIDNDGEWLWAKSYGEHDSKFYSAVINNDAIYITGETAPHVSSNTFDNYELIYENTFPNHSQYQSNAYILKTDLSGNPIKGACFGFVFPTMVNTHLAASSNKVYLGGIIPGTHATFGSILIDGLQFNAANYIAVYSDYANILSGHTFYDLNSNGIFDPGEPAAQIFLKTSSGSTEFNTYTNGYYQLGVGIGTFLTEVVDPPLHFTYNPEEYSNTFTELNSNSVENMNFAFQPIPNQSDIVTDLSATAFRPGFTGVAHVIVSNIGTTEESGILELELGHPEVTITSVEPEALFISGNTAEMFYDLGPIENQVYTVNFQVGVTAELGSPVTCVAIAENPQDLTPENNTAVLNRVITGSFDPNDKLVLPAGDIYPEFVQNDGYIEYTVRFQNTGNDTAFTVIIIDTLSNYFDLSTFSVISHSHPMITNLYDEEVWFRFNNILLPDSNTNEPLSHGFVKFKIKLLETVQIGDLIENTAYIYFDYNEPIITNTTQTLVTIPTGLCLKQQSHNIEVFPNPSSGIINVLVDSDMVNASYSVFDLRGRILKSGLITDQNTLIDISELKRGLYLLQVVDKESIHNIKLLRE